MGDTASLENGFTGKIKDKGKGKMAVVKDAAKETLKHHDPCSSCDALKMELHKLKQKLSKR